MKHAISLEQWNEIAPAHRAALFEWMRRHEHPHTLTAWDATAMLLWLNDRLPHQGVRVECVNGRWCVDWYRANQRAKDLHGATPVDALWCAIRSILGDPSYGAEDVKPGIRITSRTAR